MQSKRGFTLVELMIVVVVIGVLLTVAMTGMDDWEDAERARVSARAVAGAFSFARGEAIRTGHNHMVFIQQDTLGATLSEDGDTVPVLVLDDGLPGSGNQNCRIDAGEPVRGFRIQDRVGFGTSMATSKPGTDEGTAAFASGTTFPDGAAGTATWVLIRPDGTPRSATTACAMGPLGSGGGGVYLGNAERELAVVLTPLGATRVYTWQEGNFTWD